MRKLLVFPAVVALLLSVGLAFAQDAKLMALWRQTPMFSKGARALTPAELNEVGAWPIIKVYILKDGAIYLALYRRDLHTGRTAAFYYEAQAENWKDELGFWLSNILGAYWVEPTSEPSRSQEVSADFWKAIRGAPASGYLRVDSNNLVLVYPNNTGGKSQETEVVYPLIVEAEGTEGLVANVLPPK